MSTSISADGNVTQLLYLLQYLESFPDAPPASELAKLLASSVTDETNKGPSTIVGIVFLTVFCCIVVALRLATRRWARGNMLGWDDWTCLAATVRAQ